VKRGRAAASHREERKRENLLIPYIPPQLDDYIALREVHIYRAAY
jgi:hypothetical protein